MTSPTNETLLTFLLSQHDRLTKSFDKQALEFEEFKVKTNEKIAALEARIAAQETELQLARAQAPSNQGTESKERNPELKEIKQNIAGKFKNTDTTADNNKFIQRS